MIYREMKKTGDKLSALGFGCMRLPQKKGHPGDGKIDEERATKQIRTAIDQGVNYIDTAAIYHMGSCEAFIGRALSDGYREKVKLATKLTHLIINSREEMDSLLNSQLIKLKTNVIDYYLVHTLDGPSWQKMDNMGVSEFLNKAKADGKITNIGFSFHGLQEDFFKIVDAYDWDFCQIQYSFLDRKNQAGEKGLKYAAEKDMGVIVMEPLRGGMLARKPPKEIEELWDTAEIKRTPAEWALRWTLNHPEVSVVLSGMNEEEHIEENIRVASGAPSGSLTEDELKLVRKVEKKYWSIMKAGCTGCRYCMPCPNGVDIPVCFETINDLKMYGNKKWADYWYMGRVALADNPGLASQCEECGECEDKCPQKLPIQNLLKDVSDEFEGRFFPIKKWLMGKGFRFLMRRGM
jgi:uncharacterized protein